MKGPDLLKEFEDNWVTDMGAWFPEGRVVLRGKDVLSELNNCRWMEYHVFAITGKESSRLARLIEGIWSISTSFPDPRLWNNRVSALAGTARSTGVLAIAAGVAVSEATIYGLRPIKGAIDFLYRVDRKREQGSSIEELVKAELRRYRAVYGYGRPLVRSDERVAPLMNFAKSLGAGNGKYIKLAFEIEDYLKNSRLKYQMNIAAVAAGLLADEGVLPQEEYYYAALSFVSGMFPCYIDALSKPEGAFFPLRTDRLEFKGLHMERKWRV